MRSTYRILVGKPERKSALRRFWSRWDFNTKTYFKRARYRDSSVDIATGYGLDDQGGGSSSPGRVKIILLNIVQTGSGVHPTSYKMGTRELFPGGKAAGA
jgi:hypothetical protein